jgi:4-amino-4-deoxy-L-arabinose transferase-like glycosyltransferase
VIIIAAYCVLFLLITGLLSSAFNPDDEKASYATQIFALNYSSRNPPLYDWILYGVQHLLGVGPFPFALVRYTFLFLFGCAAYALARRAIADPRLQALSVFSISLLWQLGYHAHRINTHSDLMIVFIASTALCFVALRDRPTVGRYALLGAMVALGTLSKFGYLAFLASTIAAALALEPYRRVLLDRRIVIAVVVAAIPLAAFFVVGTLAQQHYVDSVMRVVLPREQMGMGATVVLLAIAWVGYVMPFLALFLLIIWPWREPSADRNGSRLDDARLFLRNLVIAATVVSCGGVLLLENTNVRDRYFNAFYPLITVYAFAEADRRRIDRYRRSAFATTVLATAGGVAALLAAQRLAPDPRLCDQCNQSIPHVQFSGELRAKFGAAPTLLADQTMPVGLER